MFWNTYSFEDKVAVLTGAGSGIGKATARALAKRDARVHLVDIDQSRLGETREEIEGLAGKDRVFSHQVDCRQADDVRALADKVYSKEGRVDILFNNAGLGLAGPTDSLSLDDWKKIIDLNLWGVIYGIHAFLPKMLEQAHRTHIVNTASGFGLFTTPFFVAYVASKFAVVGMTESLSMEYGDRNVNFSVICPGFTNTSFVEDAPASGGFNDYRDILQKLYDFAASSPDDVADTVLKAIRKKRVIQLAPTWQVIAPWLLRRVSPRLYRLILSQVDALFFPNPD